MWKVLTFFAVLILSHAQCSKSPFIPSNERGAFTLRPLPYDYDALEPLLWSQIVFIHHERHERGAFGRFRMGASNSLQASSSRIEELARDLSDTDPLRGDLLSYYSHYLYWLALSPTNCSHAPPQAELMQALNATWGPIENFQTAFLTAAEEMYEAGWVYLCGSPAGLVIRAVPQDDSWGDCVPLLALDIWEHSYYLQYLSSKTDYLNGWWSLLDWELLEALYVQYISQGSWVPV